MVLLTHMRRAQPAAAGLARRAVRAPLPARAVAGLDAKFGAALQLAPVPFTFGGSQRAFSSSPLVSGYASQ